MKRHDQFGATSGWFDDDVTEPLAPPLIRRWLGDTSYKAAAVYFDDEFYEAKSLFPEAIIEDYRQMPTVVASKAEIHGAMLTLYDPHPLFSFDPNRPVDPNKHELRGHAIVSVAHHGLAMLMATAISMDLATPYLSPSGKAIEKSVQVLPFCMSADDFQIDVVDPDGNLTRMESRDVTRIEIISTRKK